MAPDTASVTEGRICHRVQWILTESQKMSESDAMSYLMSAHDFNALHEPLAQLSLNRLRLVCNVPYSKEPSQTIRNHAVICLEHFRAQEKQSGAFVAKWLRKLSLSCGSLSDKQISSKVQSVMDKVKKMKHNKGDACYELFLNTNFPSEESWTASEDSNSISNSN